MSLRYCFACSLLFFSLFSFSAQSESQSWGCASNSPLQSPGPYNDTGYWLDEFNETLITLQATYWNGTYWPSTIQWIGAFLDTLLAASDETFTNLLVEYNGSIPDSTASSQSVEKQIKDYYAQIEAYYGNEDTSQIFAAAYDDAQWVVLEWLEALKFVNQYGKHLNSDLGQVDIAKFAHRAHIFYNIVQNQFDTPLCDGGLTWNPAFTPYKNAITNQLFIASSIGMYLYFPGDSNSDPYPSPDFASVTNTTLPRLPALQAHDPLLLNNAIEGYEWFRSHNFTNAQGLIIDGFHISPNQTTCDLRSEMVYTYNQGIVLSGLRGLWEATGNSSYLEDGYSLIATTINATGWNACDLSTVGQWAGLGRKGIMEEYCDASANCSQDTQSFKGEYFHHLDQFCILLPTSMPLVAGLTKLADLSTASLHEVNCASYTTWIEHNAYAALSTRDASNIIGGWWGASFVNHTQTPAPEWTVSVPKGGLDVRSEPSVLKQSPWACQEWYCDRSEVGREVLEGRWQARGMYNQRRRRRDANDAGRGRTVETHAAGLSVVKAAADFKSRRKAL